MKRTAPLLILTLLAGLAACTSIRAEESPFPGDRGVKLDTACRKNICDKKRGGFLAKFVKVPRDQVVGFALYTHDHGVLKMSAQLYPLKEGEERRVRLELKTDGQWREVATARGVDGGHPGDGPWRDDARQKPESLLGGERCEIELGHDYSSQLV